MINTLMIFAAGFGTRLLPITKNIPKSLITVAGKTLLEHALDFALNFPFEKIIINTHYLAEQIEQAVKDYISKVQPDAEIIVVHESLILETGGAIKNAIEFFGSTEQIFTLNSDSIISCDPSIWQYMLERWNCLEMDFMMLITPIDRCFGSVGRGDFDLNSDGSLHVDNYIRNFMFSGLQILKPNLVMQCTEDVFSLSQFYKNNRARLIGCVNPGYFYHISTINDYQNAQIGNLKHINI